MPATTISAQDKTLGDAIRTELKNMFEQGTTGGGTIAAPFGGTTMPSVAMDMYELIAIAVLRVFKTAGNGVSEGATSPPYPQRLPQYVKTALPDPGANEGSVIFVLNDVGGAVLAFSDSVNWLRVTDRAIIS